MGGIQQTLVGSNSDTLLTSHFEGPPPEVPAENCPSRISNRYDITVWPGGGRSERAGGSGERFDGGRLISSNKVKLTHAVLILVTQNQRSPFLNA